MNITTIEAIQELMDKWNEYRGKWIEKFGSDKGFDIYFTQQVTV